MKYLFSLLALSLVLSTTAQDAKINWVSVNELAELQKKESRKVLIDVYTKWCGPCKMMMKTTFHDPGIVNFINKHFYAVKFDAEGNEEITFKGHKFTNEGYQPNKPGRNSTHDLTLAIAPVQGRIAYPTIVYMDENLDILFPTQGFMRPPQILPMLNYIKDEKYKEVQYNDYVKSYEKGGSSEK